MVKSSVTATADRPTLLKRARLPLGNERIIHEPAILVTAAKVASSLKLCGIASLVSVHEAWMFASGSNTKFPVTPYNMSQYWVLTWESWQRVHLPPVVTLLNARCISYLHVCCTNISKLCHVVAKAHSALRGLHLVYRKHEQQDHHQLPRRRPRQLTQLLWCWEISLTTRYNLTHCRPVQWCRNLTFSNLVFNCGQ